MSDHIDAAESAIETGCMSFHWTMASLERKAILTALQRLGVLRSETPLSREAKSDSAFGTSGSALSENFISCVEQD